MQCPIIEIYQLSKVPSHEYDVFTAVRISPKNVENKFFRFLKNCLFQTNSEKNFLKNLTPLVIDPYGPKTQLFEKFFFRHFPSFFFKIFSLASFFLSLPSSF